MTNLLQPADVCWFAPIKKRYRDKWNHWFTFENKEFTRNLNMKSPGYVLCSNWMSEIWRETSGDLIRKSFEICGVHNNHQLDSSNNIQIRLDNLHSTLKTMLADSIIMHQSIDIDRDLAEADANMNNNNNDVFERGSGEDEAEFGVAEDQEDSTDSEETESNEMDIDEMNILREGRKLIR